MNIKEVTIKSEVELKHLLLELKKKLDDLQFKVAQKQLKNVREVRTVKRDIARVLTVLDQKKKAAPSDTAKEEKPSSDKKETPVPSSKVGATPVPSNELRGTAGQAK